MSCLLLQFMEQTKRRWKTPFFQKLFIADTLTQVNTAELAFRIEGTLYLSYAILTDFTTKFSQGLEGWRSKKKYIKNHQLAF